MKKPLLLGMNNPLSDDPHYDLYPYPDGSAGHRLWQLMPEGMTRGEYLRAFDRRNLLRAREWSAPAARRAAAALLPELHGRVVVVLGTEVRAALGLPKVLPLTRQEARLPLGAAGDRVVRFEWVALPHPSGRNYWYNDDANREAARALLSELVAHGAAGGMFAVTERLRVDGEAAP